MISKSFLQEEKKISPIRAKNISKMTINDLAYILTQSCINTGLNVSVTVDKVDSGKLFDKTTYDCVVITSNDHPDDYFQSVILMMKSGIYTYLDFYYMGRSKNYKKINNGDREHSTITGMIFGAIQKATVSEQQLLDEDSYYEMVKEAIRDALDSIFNNDEA